MPLTLSEESTSALVSLSKCFGQRFDRVEFNESLEEVDTYYHMVSVDEMETKDKQEDQEVSTRYQRTDLPIVRQQVQSEVPFMENIFLNEKPIFSVVRNNLPEEIKQAAKGVNAKIEQDQMVANWIYHLSKFHLDCAKYNIGAVEVTWGTKLFTNFTTNVEAPSELTSTTEEWSGNEIKHINPYNLFFDQSVDPSEVAEKGEYAGYIEHPSQVELYKLWLSIKDLPNAHAHAPAALWQSSENYEVDSKLQFESPKITDRIKKRDSDDTDWAAFSGSPIAEGNMNFKKLGDPSRHYHVVTLYCRIIPAQLNITTDNKESAEQVQIWRLRVVNGTHLFSAEPLNNAHGLIPLAICQPDNDTLGINGKSNVQCTINIQHLAQQFMDKRLAGIDRSINDRGIFNPKYIDGEHFKKKIPDGKIPLKSSAQKQGFDIKSAYLPLDYRDNTSSILNMEIPFLQQVAQQTNLSNASRSGQYAKGNKTPDEVRATLSNAEAPLLRRAQQINVQAYALIKKIIKFNLLQKGEAQELFSEQQGQEVTFEPKTLLQQSISFKLAGGLEPLSMAMNSGELQMLFDIAQTNPIIGQTYNIFGIFEDMFYAKGVDLSSYRLPPQPTEGQVAGQAAQQPPAGGEG